MYQVQVAIFRKCLPRSDTIYYSSRLQQKVQIKTLKYQTSNTTTQTIYFLKVCRMIKNSGQRRTFLITYEYYSNYCSHRSNDWRPLLSMDRSLKVTLDTDQLRDIYIYILFFKLVTINMPPPSEFCKFELQNNHKKPSLPFLFLLSFYAKKFQMNSLVEFVWEAIFFCLSPRFTGFCWL